MTTPTSPSPYRPRSTRGHVRRNQRTMPNWFVFAIGIAGLAALFLLLRSLVTPLFDDEEGGTSNSNRAWLSDNWTNQAPTRPQVEALVTRLQDNKIDMVYVQTGAWRQDGQYRAWDYADDFRVLMRDIAPDIKVLDWITVDGQRNQYAADNHTMLVNYARQTINEWRYDGVHLQGFSVFDGNENFVRLLRAFDELLGDDRTLSVTGPPDFIPSDPAVPPGLGNPSISWDPRYKQQIALIVDEIVIMAHASGLTTPEEYEQWMAYQIETYSKDISRVEVETNLIVAFPNYPSVPLHDPTVENLTTAIIAAKQGIKNAGGAGNRVVGGGIYIYNEASEQDWLTFKKEWVDR